MRKVKMVNIQTAFQEGKVLVRLQGLTAEQSLKDWACAEWGRCYVLSPAQSKEGMRQFTNT